MPLHSAHEIVSVSLMQYNMAVWVCYPLMGTHAQLKNTDSPTIHWILTKYCWINIHRIPVDCIPLNRKESTMRATDCKLGRHAGVVRGSRNLTILVMDQDVVPISLRVTLFVYQSAKLIRRHSTSEFPQAYPCTSDKDESLTFSGAVSVSPQLV